MTDPPSSIVRARELLARRTVQQLPDMARLSGEVKASPDSARRADTTYGLVLEAAFLVAAADGELTKEEIGQLADLVAQMTSQLVSPSELADAIADHSAQLERAGRGAMIEAMVASCSDPGVRREALGFAALVALCDGELAPAELFVLHSMGKAFGLGAGEVNEIIRSLKTELGVG